MIAAQILEQDFGTLSALICAHAKAQPRHPALVTGEQRLDYGELDRLMNRIAASLERDGVRPREAIAICAASSNEYAAMFLGALRAGVAVAPLAPSSTPESLAAMVEDADARLFFVDAAVADALGTRLSSIRARIITLDGTAAGRPLQSWLATSEEFAPVAVEPDWPFNIIYSSGTTGTPKGIVQSHGMRWLHVRRASTFGYGPTAVTIISTPLYSNTTLVSFFPAIATGGTCVLMSKFDVVGFLELAQRHRATHAMLVPVQYQRIMSHPDFGKYDLASFIMKFSTSAPFAATLKTDVLARWPGGLIEYYGMTEGGGTCILAAHQHPDKLHTVGQPAPDHDIRVIDEAGRELPPGETGEVVGHSAATMNGYHNNPAKTAEAEWRDASGKRFIRTGDVGRFDAEGFLTLLDRKKDMIISGGFNIYPTDLELVLIQHPAVSEVAVVGVPSARWGETPVAFVVGKPGQAVQAEELRAFANERLGKTQRIAAVEIVPALPRSPIGKVLKRELRERVRLDE